jgi:hypothetical protein
VTRHQRNVSVLLWRVLIAIEGVKYDRLSAVLINAVNEQQAQIERQQQQLQEQQAVIGGLRKLVCQNNPRAEVCKGRETK